MAQTACRAAAAALQCRSRRRAQAGPARRRARSTRSRCRDAVRKEEPRRLLQRRPRAKGVEPERPTPRAWGTSRPPSPISMRCRPQGAVVPRRLRMQLLTVSQTLHRVSVSRDRRRGDRYSYVCDTGCDVSPFVNTGRLARGSEAMTRAVSADASAMACHLQATATRTTVRCAAGVAPANDTPRLSLRNLTGGSRG